MPECGAGLHLCLSGMLEGFQCKRLAFAVSPNLGPFQVLVQAPAGSGLFLERSVTRMPGVSLRVEVTLSQLAQKSRKPCRCSVSAQAGPLFARCACLATKYLLVGTSCMGHFTTEARWLMCSQGPRIKLILGQEPFQWKSMLSKPHPRVLQAFYSLRMGRRPLFRPAAASKRPVPPLRVCREEIGSWDLAWQTDVPIGVPFGCFGRRIDGPGLPGGLLIY